MDPVTAVVIPCEQSSPLRTLLVPKSVGVSLQAILIEIQESIARLDDVRQRLLIRPGSGGTAGLYAYEIKLENQSYSSRNVRATRLAMACGLFATKFFNTVLLVRASIALQGRSCNF